MQRKLVIKHEIKKNNIQQKYTFNSKYAYFNA